ncbi:hypothetical protein BuS5_01167 [Desulfosarcina sp. BuS5]|nr:hypothetical protein BuS5_01167 [Desulfosarcina sp. BuS5]
MTNYGNAEKIFDLSNTIFIFYALLMQHNEAKKDNCQPRAGRYI